MARREAPALSRGSAATTNNGCATWRAIPLVWRGAREDDGVPGAANNTGDDACPTQRRCLKSESEKLGNGPACNAPDVMAGLTRSVVAGFIPAIHVLLAAMS